MLEVVLSVKKIKKEKKRNSYKGTKLHLISLEASQRSRSSYEGHIGRPIP